MCTLPPTMRLAVDQRLAERHVVAADVVVVALRREVVADVAAVADAHP